MAASGKYKKIKVRKGYTRDEHRIVMENILGRSLSRTEVVHHKDGDKSNNDPSNLQVMSVQAHASLHSKGHKAHNKIEYPPGQGWCHICKSFLPMGNFAADKEKYRGRACIPCERVRRRKRYLEGGC